MSGARASSPLCAHSSFSLVVAFSALCRLASMQRALSTSRPRRPSQVASLALDSPFLEGCSPKLSRSLRLLFSAGLLFIPRLLSDGRCLVRAACTPSGLSAALHPETARPRYCRLSRLLLRFAICYRARHVVHRRPPQGPNQVAACCAPDTPTRRASPRARRRCPAFSSTPQLCRRALEPVLRHRHGPACAAAQGRSCPRRRGRAQTFRRERAASGRRPLAERSARQSSRCRQARGDHDRRASE